MEEEGAWKYVVTLSGKLEKISITDTLTSSLSMVGKKLACRDWEVSTEVSCGGRMVKRASRQSSGSRRGRFFGSKWLR